MNRVLIIAAVTITTLLVGCATAPPEPRTQLSPLGTYANMDCQQLYIELGTVNSWIQHQTDMNAYMREEASSSKTLESFGAVLGAIGSSADPSMAGTFAANSRSAKAATAQFESYQAQAAAHQEGLVRRQAAVGKLMEVKGCR